LIFSSAAYAFLLKGIDDNKDGGRSPANKDAIVPAALVILCYYYDPQQGYA
jgi:hypothetical protein